MDNVRAKVEAAVGLVLRARDNRAILTSARNTLRLVAEQVPAADRVEVLVALAGHTRLCEWTAEFIRQGEAVPAPLDKFAVEVITGQRSRTKRGPARAHNWRDIAITLGMWTATNAGLVATRNDATERLSAADLVADVLSSYGYPTTYATVKKAWRKPPLPLDPACRDLRFTIDVPL